MSSGSKTSAMSSVEDFETHRPYLFSVAYRMLGSVADAEDMLQDAYLKWQKMAAGEICSLRSFLVTMVTRLCIDRLRSTKAAREEYIGPWLPEPLVAQAPTPEEQTELADSLSFAFLVLLESLSPVERAVFLLREVFGFEFSEIAEVVEKSEANSRQIFSRARRHLADRRARFVVERQNQRRMFDEFIHACQTGDLEQLLKLLTDDVTCYCDGGGKAVAARRPIRSADHVARFLLGILKKAPEALEIRPATINGSPGAVIGLLAHAYSVVSIETTGDRVSAVYIVSNPDKLRNLTEPG